MQQSVYQSLSQDAIAAAESLAIMLQKEQSIYYKSSDYLRPTPANAGNTISELDRIKIVDWCYNVIDQCQFDRETVAITMDLIDRFLSKSDHVLAQEALRDRNQFQLLAMAALYTAIKTNEKYALRSHFFSAMSREVYSASDIETMEMNLLKGLSWRLNTPTSVQIAHHVLSLVFPLVDLQESTWGYILDEVRFQTEHAVRDYCLSMQRPSTVAIAAIFGTVDQDQVSKKDREAILKALLLVINQDFAPLEYIVGAKNRLNILLSGVHAVAMVEEDIEVVSESSREVEASSSFSQFSQLKRELDENFDEQTASKIPRISPQATPCSSTC